MVTNVSCCLLVLVLLATAVLIPTQVMAAVKLDTGNPLANFSKEGGQFFTASPAVISLLDQDVADIVDFFAVDPDAAPGTDLDLFAVFQIRSVTPFNADTGVHLVINDGQSKAVVAACIIIAGVKGIGLAAGENFSDPINYPVFVPVDWASPTSVRIRRTAAGDGEIVELNGVELNPRPVLAGVSLPPRNRVNPTIEFGAAGVEALVNVEFNQVFSEKPGAPLTLFTNLGARADILLGRAAHGDRFDVEAQFTLGTGSNGIDSLTQDLTLTLGPRTWTIPAGSFRRLRGGTFTFEGIVGATRLGVVITPLRGGRFGFAALGAGADLSGIANPVPFALTIGDDTGSTNVFAHILY